MAGGDGIAAKRSRTRPGGLLFRESDGHIQTSQSYQEFAVEAPPRERNLRKSPPWEIGDDGRLEEDYSLPPVEPEAYSLPPRRRPPDSGAGREGGCYSSPPWP